VIRQVGEHPVRAHFDRYTASRYPPAVTRLITLLCIVLLLAAFTPSAIRLYVIGSQTFGVAVPDALAQVAVGIATVLTAEIGQVVFSLALATLGTSPGTRRLLFVSMGIATAIALVERELQADDWYSAPTVAPEAEAQEQASAPRPFAVSANGHHPQIDLLTSF
jgi:hypothetical protein